MEEAQKRCIRFDNHIDNEKIQKEHIVPTRLIIQLIDRAVNTAPNF
ncbi:hypothetical protein [Tenacibaculum sp. SG-28]|nr:hypothetical protein [Tenacibaculum sp. SG-28]